MQSVNVIVRSDLELDSYTQIQKEYAVAQLNDYVTFKLYPQ